jgi:hypothetical protein
MSSYVPTMRSVASGSVPCRKRPAPINLSLLAVVLLAATQQEAERLIANDPAVVSNVMRATVRQWLAERVRSY